jgi:hypothetical protein
MDRDVVLLRFLLGRSFTQVGEELGMSDDAAQKRVERALHKLRRLLAGRGITSLSVAGLGAALNGTSSNAARAHVVATSGAAIQQTSTSAASSLAEGAIRMMFLLKAKLIATTVIGVVLALAGVAQVVNLGQSTTAAEETSRRSSTLPATSDPADPKDVLAAVAERAWVDDTRGAAALFVADNELEQRWISAMLDMVIARNRVHQAWMGKFGPMPADLVRQIGGITPAAVAQNQNSMHAAITDDQATLELVVSNRRRPSTINLVRSRGVWKIRAASFAQTFGATTPALMDSLIAIFARQVEGYQRMARDFSAREFASREEATDWMYYALSSGISEPPPSTEAAPLARQIQSLFKPGAQGDPIRLYERAKAIEGLDTESWFPLGLLLYDAGGRYDTQALDAFVCAEKSARLSLDQYAALVWQGHILDLQGQREQALDRYRRAEAVDYAHEISHDQYHMKINGTWIKQRLAEPFQRPRP